MKKAGKRFCIAVSLLAAFALWTVAVCFVDVRAIGPQGSRVGLAGINRFVHDLTGMHLALYTLTDLLSMIPIGVCIGFGTLGLVQWIKRKSLLRVDRSILVLGGLYAVTIAAYLFFETVVVNYRPVLIDGVLEASYPSSTTVLVLCVLPTCAMQLRKRIENRAIRKGLIFASNALTAFMVIGRLLSGVHWASDIVGGLLLAGGLVMLYDAIVRFAEMR